MYSTYTFKYISYASLFPNYSCVPLCQVEIFFWNLFLIILNTFNLLFDALNCNNSWKKKLFLHFSADEKFDGTYQTNVVVSNEGSCLYVPPGIFKSTCKIDITWFPFDDQLCDLKFGSWTYSGWKVSQIGFFLLHMLIIQL